MRRCRVHRIPLVAVAVLVVVLAVLLAARASGGPVSTSPPPERPPLVIPHFDGFRALDATVAWREGTVVKWYAEAKPKPRVVPNKRATTVRRTPAYTSVGPWAIPTYIVMCESGGTNAENPRSTASGYYQILDSTWAAHGGVELSGVSHASAATLAQQSIIAARIWASGGASQWACS